MTHERVTASEYDDAPVPSQGRSLFTDAKTAKVCDADPRAIKQAPASQAALSIGSLCTGYGGLDMAVLEVFGGRLRWVADNDRHVSTILRARMPDVPNLGDLTALDWRHAPPVDILCAGFPCQDISFAGRGAGIVHCAGVA